MLGLMRASFLLALTASLGSLGLLAACSSSSNNDGTGGDGGASSHATTGSSSSTGKTVLPGPSDWNRDVTPPEDGEASDKRSSCGYKAGDLPAETQGKSHPSGADIPIDHIIILMKENRSFDHYFQKLPEYGQPDVEVAPADFSNKDKDGNDVKPILDPTFCFVDTNHEWSGTHEQVNGGKMDGFYTSNDGNHEAPAHGTLDSVSGARAMVYNDQTTLPFYYALANEYSIADHYHCSVQGPTWPNRMYLYAATSFGLTSNTFPEADKTLPDYLEMRQLDWMVYSDGTPGFAMFTNPWVTKQYFQTHLKSIADFYADAAAGKLPQVVFLDPVLGAENYNQNDEHPPAIAQIGEAFTAQAVDAIQKSPNWPSTALFITYDEHGGLYDHVVPPKACPPDDTQPILAAGDPPGGFDELGVRVPMIVVSPFAKKHYVSHNVYDHTSIVRFVEDRFVIPALTNRDANALAPWDMFDFDNAPHKTPPAVTIPTPNQATIDACAKIYVP